MLEGINLSQRSIIHKITEKDHPASLRMVLRISNINPESEHKINQKRLIELTDGYYPIITSLDEGLSELISEGKLKMNDKLVICNARIVLGMDVSDHPLEAYDRIILGINYNCVRKAENWVKLGACQSSHPFSVLLRSIRQENSVGAVHVRILRKYDPEYCERYDDGSFIYRSLDEESKEKHKRKSMMLEDSNIIYNELMNKSMKDNSLNYEGDFNKTIISETERIITEKVKYLLNKHPERKVSCLNRYKVQGLYEDYPPTEAFLYMWNQSEEMIEMFKVGKLIGIFNLNCSNIKSFHKSFLKVC